MREILFRGLQMFHENNDWVYGYLKIGDIAGKRTAFIIPADFDKCKIKEAPVYERTVGQYTGLTDKNGVKIFEGDIIRTAGNLKRLFVVYWSDKSIQFVKKDVRLDDGAEYGIPNIPIFEYEVVGNIYDNPELLEEEE